MAEFVSARSLIAQAPLLFAEVRDFAIPVDLHYSLLLVVEDDLYFRRWVVHGTSALWRAPMFCFVAPKRAFVVPI